MTRDDDRDRGASTRTLEPGAPRLTTELRLIGTTGLLWVVAAAHAAGWLWVTGLWPTSAPPSVWAAVLAVQVGSFTVVTIGLGRSIPLQRWPLRGTVDHAERIWLRFVPGFIALPFVPWLLVRARRRSDAATGEALEQARNGLLQLPRTSALRLLGWAALAYCACGIILGIVGEWPRGALVAVVLLWVALAGPVAAIAYGWSRAILRPEYLSAPAQPITRLTQTHDMRVRLVVGASIASAGAIIAPLAAGYLWLSSAERDRGGESARHVAVEAVMAATEGDDQRLTALLDDNPGLTVVADGQTYGALRRHLPIGHGLIDEDGDGAAEIVVVREGHVAAVMPLEGPGTVPTDGLWVGGLACLLCCVIALGLVASDLHRDVVRANEQVKAVAQGRAPPPMSELSLSSLEIRELVQSVDRLVGRITEANVAKYIAIEKAKEADRLKSQFLANMSHDLRSPLNSILGFSELLISGIDGEVTAEQRASLELIHDSGRHLLQQIDDILDTAKIEAGRLDMHPEPTPPATLVARAIQNAKKRGREGIEYRTVFAAGLPPAFCDPYRSVQALENVLLFAAERVERGVIEVDVRRGRNEDRRMIFIQVRTPARPATTEQLARARRGFYRIPGHRGLGLGLPIAGSILELAGGSLGIEDTGEGMEFSLLLPAPEARRAVRLRVDEARHETHDSRADPDEHDEHDEHDGHDEHSGHGERSGHDGHDRHGDPHVHGGHDEPREAD